MDKSDVQELLQYNHKHKFQKRSWSWAEIEDGENYLRCRTNEFPWLSNVNKTSWFCRLFHWFWWCHDLDRWDRKDFPYYYILCRRCGRCWMAVKPIA